MVAARAAVLLRIFVTENDLTGSDRLYRVLVERAMSFGMAGATVLYAPGGFGHSRMWRSELNVDAGAQLPVVIEIVDSEEKIRRFLPTVDSLIQTGLVTLEEVQAVQYRAPPPKAHPARENSKRQAAMLRFGRQIRGLPA